MSDHDAAERPLAPFTSAPALWPFSGRGPAALRAQARILGGDLDAGPEPPAAAVADALRRSGTGRAARAVAAASDGTGPAAAVRALADGRPHPGLVTGGDAAGGPVFVFPGQGSQWTGMAAALLESSPVFAAEMARCEEALAPYVDWSPTAVVRGDEDAPDLAAADVVQPALFAVMVSLAGLWRSCGVEPHAVVGHSLGEVAAAHVAGALTLEDAARVVALWSRAQATVQGAGEMVSVLLPEDDARARLAPWEGRLDIAAVNGPGAVIVSGDADAAAAMLERLTGEGVQARRIDVGLAAHSPHMDALLPGLREELAPVRPAEPAVPLYSSLQGGRVDGVPMDAGFWCRCLRGTVRFRQAVAAATGDGRRLLVEIGPHPVLTAAVQSSAEDAGHAVAVQETLRRGDGGADRFLRSLAELYVQGAEPDWAALLPADVPHWDGAEEAVRRLAEAGGSDEPDPAGTGAQDEAARLLALSPGRRLSALTALVCAHAAAAAGRTDAAELDPRMSFMDIGFDSVTAVALRNDLRGALGVPLPTTLAFDHPTPEAVARHVAAVLTGEEAESGPGPAAFAAEPDEPVAIVGMGCRYPGGSDTPEELWRLVMEEADAVGGFPVDRGWDTGNAFDPHGRRTEGRYYQREAGFLYGAGEFDAGFFGISPREAVAMDPQQRLLLETSWEAVERAGVDPSSLRGSRTGVYIGAMTMDYGPRGHEAGEESGGYVLTGTTGSVASGRISYALGLEGPAVTVDTACSSSLVALHQACQALRQGECEAALVGGATVMPSLSMLVEFSRQGGLSADGRCKAFADAADGFGLAEGVGVVMVERLSRARELGHRVLAVVRGSAVNQDGASNGLTAPSGPSQQRVIRQALANAGLSASDVDAVEAHGTGTRLGDPIEAQALLATYGRDRGGADPLWLGSLKSNIGHTQAAAGLGGVIKTVLAMRNGVLPRTLHVDAPSSQVDWEQGEVRLLTEARPWPQGDRPRRGAVSSFGVSGTNAHVLLEEGPEEPAAAPERAPDRGEPVPWPLSGRTAAALRAQAERLHACLEDKSGYDRTDVGYSLAVTRSDFARRAVVLARDGDEGLRGLAAIASGESAPQVVTGTDTPGRTVFVFPGQGSQWRAMATRLWDESPVFAARMRECADALAEFTDWSLADVLYEAEGAPELDRVDVVQPALFAVMVSLAALWRAEGVEPDAVVGHSQGEIAAACVAGALTLRDAACVVARRSRAIRDGLAGSGGMMSVALPAAELPALVERWEGRISLAAANGPASAVVSGDPAALEELRADCEGRGVRARIVPVDYASHSAQVEEVRDRVLRDLDALEPRVPDVPLYSSVTGGPDTPELLDASYWYENLRRTVAFSDTVRTLSERGHTVFIEVSPHPVLVPHMQDTFEAIEAPATALGSLRRDEGGRERFLTSLMQAHAAGAEVDWESVFTGTGARRVDLPTYAFQRRRHWQEPVAAAAQAAPDAGPEQDFWAAVESGDVRALHGVVGPAADELEGVLPALAEWRRGARERAAVDSWRYRIAWRPVGPFPAEGRLSGRWLVALPRDPAAGGAPDGADGDGGARGADELEGALRRAGADPVRVPFDPDTDPAALADALRAAAGGEPVAGAVALFAPEASAAGPLPGGTAAGLALVQALGDAPPAAGLWFLTTGAVSVSEHDPAADPAHAQLWGMGRIAGLEHPGAWGGSVDLPGPLDAALASRVAAVLAGAGDEDGVALRDGGTYVRRLHRARLGSDAPPRAWRPRGTALVTGGTGALGGHVARWLARNGAEHVVLTSRRGPDAPGADALAAEVAGLGAEVSVVACDIADRRRAEELVRDVERTAGPIRTVVHTAGVLRNASLAESDRDLFAEVLAGKVEGARHLDELLDGESVDAFVLFSSNGGVWGSPGQGAYAAANACLDALAERRRAKGLPATSVAWGLWDGGGTMADAATEEYLSRNGLRPMDPDAAVAALQRTLDHDETFVSVADVDWALFAPGYTAARARPLIMDLAEVRAALEERTAPEEEGEEAGALLRELAGVPALERESRLLALIGHEVAAVLGLESADGVPRTRAFRELGFDSLTAVELRNRIGAAVGTRLPATLVFDYPNPAALAAHLRESLFPEEQEPQGAVEDTAEDARVREALARVPVARLRASGLLDAVLGSDDGRPDHGRLDHGRLDDGRSDGEERINELDEEALVRMALGGAPDDTP